MKKLEQYHQNLLDEQGKEAITQRLIQQKFDRDFRKQFEGELKKRGVNREEPTRFRSIFNNRWLAVAAGLSLLITAFFLFRNSFNSPALQLAQGHLDNLNIMADQIVSRKGGDIADEWKTKANNAFLSKDYNTAITWFNRLKNEGKADAFDYFYLGISFLLNKPNDMQQAILNLENARTLGKELNQEIDWVLALAYLKNGQEEIAKKQLQIIIDNEQYMDEAAKKLLKALEL